MAMVMVEAEETAEEAAAAEAEETAVEEGVVELVLNLMVIHGHGIPFYLLSFCCFEACVSSQRYLSTASLTLGSWRGLLSVRPNIGCLLVILGNEGS